MGCDTENCSHNCESCAQKPQSPQDMREKPNQMSSIKKVVGIISGKGGVGKSTVTSLLAVMMQRAGYRTGVLLSLIHIWRRGYRFFLRPRMR